MNRRIAFLLANDVAVAWRSKTIFLILFVPLFVFFALSAVDRPDNQAVRVKLALLSGTGSGASHAANQEAKQVANPANQAANQPGSYPVSLVAALSGPDAPFSVVWSGSIAAAEALLKARQVDGVLLPAAAGQATLVVTHQDSVQTLAMLAGLAQLQQAADSRGSPSWVGELRATEAGGGLEAQTLPIWVLMLVLLVGFLVMPPQVAEEKEKRWLLGLLQTQVRESDWLIAKLLLGMGLCAVPIGLLHLLSGIGWGRGLGYPLFILAGGFCFSALGILLGCLCRTQASARAFGVILYLPHLLPSALGDVSTKLQAVAAFVPSYQLFTPVRGLLLGDESGLAYRGSWLYLVVMGLVCSFGAHALVKRRWLLSG